MSINSITLTGRAGRDPEVRYFENGSMVANVSIAIDKFKRDEKPDWFDVKLWGKQAQVAADYLRKGSLFGVTGRLEWETWTDPNTGEERKKPVIVADRLQLLGSKRDSEAEQPSDEEVPF
jgi:single-strand DNA-binding protein